LIVLLTVSVYRSNF